MSRRYKKNRYSWKRTGDVLRDRYNAYLRAYDKQERKLSKQGLEMSDTKYDFNEWIEQWSKKRNDLQYEVNIGQRKGIGNVNQYLVRDQAYELSYKAGEAVYKALQERGEVGEGISRQKMMVKIRQGEFLKSEGWWDAIQSFREQLKKEGYAPDMIRQEVSRQFYGSE